MIYYRGYRIYHLGSRWLVVGAGTVGSLGRAKAFIDWFLIK